jgi:hypothetical protein
MTITYGPATPWPPIASRMRRALREYEAWYSGDPDALGAVYGAQLYGGIPRPRPSQYRGGAVGAMARLWWGRPITANQGTTRLHVPAASDLSTYSADALFGDSIRPVLPPGVPDGMAVQLESDLRESGLAASLLEAAETASWAGGAYLRVFVDPEVAGTPLVDVLAPDNAVPTWQSGRLVGVIFWRDLNTLGVGRTAEVWRHLEQHVVENGGGVVYHGLFKGDADTLGRQLPLASHPETAPLARLVDEFGGVPTGIRVLDVAYLPNVRPCRALRGTPAGRSDYEGAISFFDALDETWSSWMRDIRLAKGRLIVPRSYLRSGGPGEGAYFDAEQEVFQAVSTLGSADQAMSLEQVQFEIRVEQHERTCAALWRSIMRSAGLSEDAFGEESSGGAATATEINRRGERTTATRSRKILYATPAVGHVLTAWVAYSADVLRTPEMAAVSVSAEWPPDLPNPEAVARTIQLLDAARAVSVREKVRMQHPRWTTDDVDTEVEAIREESGIGPVADPDGS